MGRRLYLAIAAVAAALVSGEGYRQEKLKQQASPMCEYEWVKDSPFWSWYFACGSEAGGGSSGAGLGEDDGIPAWKQEDAAIR